MKILQLRSDLIENGPATQLKSLTDAWLKEGHVVIVASGGGVFADKLIADGYDHRLLPQQVFGARSILGIFDLTKALHSLLLKENPDVVLCHNMFLTTLCFLCKLTTLKRFRLANMVHGLDYSNRWRNLIYLLPVKYVSISSFTTKWLRSIGVSNKRIVKVPNGVDSNIFDLNKSSIYREQIRSEFEIPSDDFVFGIVGRMGIKGHDLLIEAVSVLVHQHGYNNICALLVGTGDKLKAFQSLAKTLEVEDKIRFAGLRLDSYRFYPAMDVYTLLSTEGEVLPISIIEAMSYGLPTIASDLSGIPDLIDNSNGSLVAPGSVKEIVKKFINIIEDSTLRETQGRNAQLRFREYFDIQVTSSRLLDEVL
jgi:glycosyltransferase involved in cell wall biosynthesis